MKHCENYQNVIQKHKVSKHCWKNSANRLAQSRVATELQFVKTAVSAKHSQVKHNKSRYVCIRYIKITEKQIRHWSFKGELWMDHSIKYIRAKTIKHLEYRSKPLWPWVKQSLLRLRQKRKKDKIGLHWSKRLFYKQYHQESEKTIYKTR